MSFAFPNAATLTKIAQDLMPNLQADRPIFEIFPTKTVNDFYLDWEQRDNYRGLMALRGLNGPPSKVNPVALNRYIMAPGVYGDFRELDEQQLTTRREIGTWGDTEDVTQMVLESQQQLMSRMYDRMEQTGWTLLATGTFGVALPNGAIANTDTYTTQVFNAGVPWATSATATPLKDLRSVQLLHRGHSVRFDATSTLYINRVTWNNLISNSNPADLYGRRTMGLGIVNNVTDFNKLATGDDLPSISIYDNGYLNDSGTFVPFIPNATGVVVGKRPPGQTIGEFRLCRNTNNSGSAPGIYSKVIDNTDRAVPRTVQVHCGYNGGIALYYASAIVIMNV